MNIEEVVTKQDAEAKRRMLTRDLMPGAQYQVSNKDTLCASVDRESLLHLGRCLKIWCADPNLHGWEQATRAAFNDCRLFFGELENA